MIREILIDSTKRNRRNLYNSNFYNYVRSLIRTIFVFDDLSVV